MVTASCKSKSRAKRKPLGDLSNGGSKLPFPNSLVKKSNPHTQQQHPLTNCGGGRPRRSTPPRSLRSLCSYSSGRSARAPAGKTSARVYNSSSGGIGSAIVDGMGFSTGSAIAHRVADAVMGPRTIRTETVSAAEPKPAITNNPFSNACDI